MSAVARAALTLLRLPGRTCPIPGWFPLVVERVHALVIGDLPDVAFASDGVRMRLDLRDYAQRRIYYLSHERSEIRFVKRFLRRGTIVIDVGAHVGLFSLIAACRVGPSGEVHAFEPAPANFAALRTNVDLNSFENIRLNCVAAGAEERTVQLGRTLGEYDSAATSGMFTVGGPGGQMTVPMIDLRRYVQEHMPGERVRLVKIDVEGLEPDVLSALDEMMSRSPPDAILLEVNAEQLMSHGYVVDDVRQPLERHGYRLFRITTTGRLKPIDGLPEPTIRALGPRRGALRQGLRTRDSLYNVVALAPGIQPV